MISLVDVNAKMYNATTQSATSAVISGRVRLMKIVARGNALSSGDENDTSPVFIMNAPVSGGAITPSSIMYQLNIPSTSALSLQLNHSIDFGLNGILFEDGLYSAIQQSPSTAPSCADFVNLFYA